MSDSSEPAFPPPSYPATGPYQPQPSQPPSPQGPQPQYSQPQYPQPRSDNGLHNGLLKGCAIGCAILGMIGLLVVIALVFFGASLGRKAINYVESLAEPVDAGNAYLRRYKDGENTSRLACSEPADRRVTNQLDKASGEGELQTYDLTGVDLSGDRADVTGYLTFPDGDRYVRFTMTRVKDSWKVCGVGLSEVGYAPPPD